ncbi:MAG TPA: hypothetical protein VFV71_07780 [Burkholderiales bacterium]|nr:hypothetical protein [Burkholderiales bacterium]
MAHSEEKTDREKRKGGAQGWWIRPIGRTGFRGAVKLLPRSGGVKFRHENHETHLRVLRRTGMLALAENGDFPNSATDHEDGP